jgi:hypothetical protein
MMTGPAGHFDAARPLLRGICLVVKGNEPRFNQREARPSAAGAGAGAKFPRRPDSRVLSESIPLFFIGRNKNGLWVSREAEGRAGGIFLLKRSALRFAGKNSEPGGCATMFLDEPFELDVENRGSPLIAWLDAVMRTPTRHASNHAASDARVVTTRQRHVKGEHP